MEEMKPQQESTATIQEPDVLTPSDGVASAIPANGAAAQESPASDASAKVIQPRPAPPMDWKRFGAPLTVLMFLTIGLVLTIQFMPRPQPIQQAETLNKIPTVIGEWSLLQEYPMSEAALNELKPDEYVARIYVNSVGRAGGPFDYRGVAHGRVPQPAGVLPRAELGVRREREHHAECA
jgi:hypothetical protein